MEKTSTQNPKNLKTYGVVDIAGQKKTQYYKLKPIFYPNTETYPNN